MTPDEIAAMLRDHRPEPPPGLRERVLAAAARVERRPPWWACVSTWSAAAAALVICNWLVMSGGDATTTQPEAQRPAVAFSPQAAAELPPILVAWLQRPSPPMPGHAPTPRTPLSEILQ